MTIQLLTFSCRINASPERVFDFFSDHESFGSIWPGSTTRIVDSDSSDGPNGVGSVRRVQQGLLVFEETHAIFERPNRLEYTVSRGGPVKNHLGRLLFNAAEGGGTDLRYAISFEPRIPFTGPLIAAAVKRSWRLGSPAVFAELSD